MKNLIEAAFHSDNSLKSNILFLLGFNSPQANKDNKARKSQFMSFRWHLKKLHKLKAVVRNFRCYLGLIVTKNVH